MNRKQRRSDVKQLTRAELEIMSILWTQPKGMSTHQIIEQFAEPKPAYATVATFLKIMTQKGSVSFHKIPGSKTHIFYPLFSREDYTQGMVKQVKHTIFGGSLSSFVRCFLKSDDITKEELDELRDLVNNADKQE